METVGIICEYNPFHNGHLYHINEVKKRYPNATIVLIMSGNFTQRGHISILNKWDKTKIALYYGVDLVIELPFVFATQSADIFAKGSIALLKALHVDKLVFGSESDAVENLIKLANIQLYNTQYDILVKQYLDTGINYPSAMSKALFDVTGKTITAPNDLLGLSYVKEIIRQGANIEAITIERTNQFHDIALTSNIVSASAIRNALKEQKEIDQYIPEKTQEYLKTQAIHEDYFPLIQYKIITEPNTLSQIQTVDEGLQTRLIEQLSDSYSLEDFIKRVKTKRYTYNKLMRMSCHLLCNFTKEEAKRNTEIRYIRVLGMSKLGQLYLNQQKKQIALPIITACNQIKDEMLDIEYRTSCIYSMIQKQDTRKQEFSKKPIRKENE